MEPYELKLRRITLHCKKYGIQEIEIEGIKLKFAVKTAGEPPSAPTTELPPNDKTAQMPSDSEMLFWSSGPDLTEKDETNV
jgi:hypothetical protein